MNWGKRAGLTVLTAVLAGSAFVLADEPTTKPAEHGHPARITQPWSKITDLSEDQKAQILKIHEQADNDIRAIHQKETADIQALLTPEQLDQVTAFNKAELAKRHAEEHTNYEKHHHHGTTEPATEPTNP